MSMGAFFVFSLAYSYFEQMLQGTLARKYSNKFDISLAYSYLCPRFVEKI